MKFIISTTLLMFLFSCAGESLLPVKGPVGDPGSELNLAEFDDIPIPLNSKLDREKSIIISKTRGWLGRLTFDTSEKQITVFDFFRNELPKFGWKKLSEVSSDTSLLNYQNQVELHQYKYQIIRFMEPTWQLPSLRLSQIK